MTDKSGIGTMVNEQYELITDALDVFGLPIPEKALISGREQTYYVVGGSMSEEGPWIIDIPNESHEFIQLNTITLYGQVKVTKTGAGGNIVDADSISIVNNLPQALFDHINVYLNNVIVNDNANSQYHYKAFIENHFSYGDSVKNTTLKGLESYIKDEVGKEEDFACDALKARKGLIKDGKVLHFYMQLHNDLLKSNRLLLPGVDIKLELKKNSAGFPLITDVANNAKFKIEKLEVTLRKLTVEPMVVGAIESKLNETPAFYPIAHSKIRNHLLAANTKNIHIPNILRGKLPRGFVILFVSNDAHSGLSTKNPFIFKHYDLDFLNVYINGEPIHANGNRPVWGDGSIVKQYKWMLDNIGLKHYISNGITLEDFVSNSCCFPYDLTPDQCNSYQSHGSDTGNVDIQLGFKTPLPEAVQVLVFATYDEVVTIDKDRVVNLISGN
jgi:hypothetical protein